MNQFLPKHGLYGLTPDIELSAQALSAQVERAIRGGANLIQYRRKAAHRDDELVLAVLKVCRAHQVPMIINDDPQLALRIGADGVHLGRNDPRINAVRESAPPNFLIGASCYDDIERARTAIAEGADYVAFGRFFPSETKPEATPCPLEILQFAATEFPVPIVAIGGVNAENAGTLIRAGADLLAVSGAIFDAPDIEAAAKSISRAWNLNRTDLSKFNDAT